ncbi:MAG: hypothetical protein FWH38_09390, partial [Treponema sp.]|nr:hypothetical protein [Treponema sp.]
MKDFYAALIACALVFWGGCGESPGDSRYALVMPGLPPAWKALLGEPQWQFEWTDGGGFPGKMTAGGGAEISVFQASPNAVSAWPFWPDRGIGPGVFR